LNQDRAGESLQTAIDRGVIFYIAGIPYILASPVRDFGAQTSLSVTEEDGYVVRALIRGSNIEIPI